MSHCHTLINIASCPTLNVTSLSHTINVTSQCHMIKVKTVPNNHQIWPETTPRATTLLCGRIFSSTLTFNLRTLTFSMEMRKIWRRSARSMRGRSKQLVGSDFSLEAILIFVCLFFFLDSMCNFSA